MWKHPRQPEGKTFWNICLNLHPTFLYFKFRLIDIIRRIILAFIIIGSLVCNIIIYIIIKMDKKQMFCSSEISWMGVANPIFEHLKRLNGLYMFVYIFSAQENYSAMKTVFLKLGTNYNKKSKAVIATNTMSTEVSKSKSIAN